MAGVLNFGTDRPKADQPQGVLDEAARLAESLAEPSRCPSPFTVRQLWIAFVGKTVPRTDSDPPHRRSRAGGHACRSAASQIVSASNQIVSAPRRLRASLQVGKFQVWWGGVGEPMRSSYRAGFMV